jgi:hypothetical protein
MPGTMKKKPTGGLKKLPTAVRNKMGYMNKGGVAKKKVIKVGVGKPYIRGGKPFTSPSGTTDPSGKLRTIHNAIETIFKKYENKKITIKERKKMVNDVLKAQEEQLKNKTYFTKKKKK